MTTGGTDDGSGARPYFKVALNLPHAGRVARRVGALLTALQGTQRLRAQAAIATVAEILTLLEPVMERDENPPLPFGIELRDQAATLGRRLVGEIEGAGLGHDRLGQCIRNFFECLELGREGADISLRAGESPSSLQRPY
jgi:hypothetical protein